VTSTPLSPTEILAPLRDGRLSLTIVVELARVLTPEHRGEILPRFFHLSRQEAMEVVAELAPRPSPPLRQVTTAVRASPPEVCGSTYRVELDHFPIPKARGGPATIDNIRVACRPHNIDAARQLFGNAAMDRYTREGSAAP
jgi:hypothetical protein